MKKFILFTICQFMMICLFAQTFTLGDKVEIYNSGAWYKGSIQETGTGNYAGYYYVHYDAYSNGQWIKASNIKLIKAAATNTNIAPRNGLYTILSYGANPANPLRLGYFELNEGKYKYYDLAKKLIGSGTYRFNSADKTIEWLTGPFKESKWNGGFEIDREGKTHKIRLNRATIGTNSTD